MTQDRPNRAEIFFLLDLGWPDYYIGMRHMSGIMRSSMTCPAEFHGSRWTHDGYWRVRFVSENISGVPHIIHRERVDF